MSGSNVKPQAPPEIVADTIYIHMGQLLGTPMKSEADAWRVEQQGIPIRNYVLLVDRFQLAPDAVGSESTLRRRVKMSQSYGEPAKQRRFKQRGNFQCKEAKHVKEARLNPAETERLMRITRVVSQATQLFGDEKVALAWLNTPGDFLHDETEVTPMKLAETDSGARMVEAMIQRTAYGFF